MSLLLDALKKAALDKQKSAATAASPAEPVTVNPADEQELTLDLEPLPAPPETGLGDGLGESLDNMTRLSKAPGTLELAETDLIPAHNDLPELATDLKPQPPEIGHEASRFDRPAKPVVSRVAAPLPTPKPRPSVAPSQQPPASLATASLAAQQAAAKQRDALDMMINKGRQSSDSKRNLQLYGLVIFSVLLLLLGGIYFYIGSEPTPVVIAASTAEEIVAPVEEPASVPQPAATLKQPATTVTASPVTASHSIPKPRRAVTTAPTQNNPVAEPLQFTKTVHADPIASLLNQAYEKFQAGDYDGANQLYAQVLHREADNRDGLLGAAAVAMKQHRHHDARHPYQKLLMLDPKDSLARAGVSFIDMDVRDESQLKFILREQPHAAHLHFALGALYASQTRWADAQQAYFNAYTGDNSNADYAYNLAVSLDQLGQFKAARGYYQKALQLTDSHRAGFVTSDLQTRIEQLSSLPDSSKGTQP